MRLVIMYRRGCFCRILLSGGGATLPLYCYNLLVIRASSMLIYRQYIHPSRARRICQKQTKRGADKNALQRTFSRKTALADDWCLTPSHIARAAVRKCIRGCFMMFSTRHSFVITLIWDFHCNIAQWRKPLTNLKLRILPIWSPLPPFPTFTF